MALIEQIGSSGYHVCMGLPPMLEVFDFIRSCIGTKTVFGPSVEIHRHCLFLFCSMVMKWSPVPIVYPLLQFNTGAMLCICWMMGVH